MNNDYMKIRTHVARALWEVIREYEDRCDLALEDLTHHHHVWFCADKAIAAMCQECQGTGLRDSGGVYPWGEHISLPCDHGLIRE